MSVEAEVDAQVTGWASLMLGRAITADATDLKAEEWDALAKVALVQTIEYERLWRVSLKFLNPEEAFPRIDGLTAVDAHLLIGAAASGGRSDREFRVEFPESILAAEGITARFALRSLYIAFANTWDGAKAYRVELSLLVERGHGSRTLGARVHTLIHDPAKKGLEGEFAVTVADAPPPAKGFLKESYRAEADAEFEAELEEEVDAAELERLVKIPAKLEAERVERLAALPSMMKLATGHVLRELAQRIPVTWKHEDLLAGGVTKKRERRYLVRLVDAGGRGVVFHPDLPGLSADAIDADEESILAALVRALPDWYSLKIIDACHTFALEDAKKDGGFWYHPARFAELLGLRGQKVGAGKYYTTLEKRRFDERFRALMALEVEITVETKTPRPGKGWRKSIRFLGKMKLLSFDGDMVKRIHLHADGKGRPAEARRVKVSAFTWTEAKRYHVGLIGEARKLYALRDGSAYKVARYLLTRAAMGAKGRGALEVREDLAQVEQYAGLEADKVREALPGLKALGIRAHVDDAGILTAAIPGGLVRFRGRKAPALPAPEGT